MNQKYLLLLLLSFCIIGGCTKEDPVYHGKIVNNISQTVHFKLYNTVADYNTNSNPVWDVDIAAGESVVVPAGFESGKDYYMDWYSEDFIYSSWPTQLKLNMANITPEMDPLLRLNANPSFARIDCLHKNDPMTTWRAYDASYFSGPSVWSGLSANEQYQEVILKKDLTGTYKYKDFLGNTTSLDFVYSVFGNLTPGTLNIFLGFSNSMSASLATPNLGGSTIVLDTLITQNNFPQANYQYSFARQ